MYHWLLRHTVCRHKGHRVRKKTRLIGHETVLWAYRCGRCDEFLGSDWETVSPTVVDHFDLGSPRVLSDEYVNRYYRDKRFMFPWE